MHYVNNELRFYHTLAFQVSPNKIMMSTLLAGMALIPTEEDMVNFIDFREQCGSVSLGLNWVYQQTFPMLVFYNALSMLTN